MEIIKMMVEMTQLVRMMVVVGGVVEKKKTCSVAVCDGEDEGGLWMMAVKSLDVVWKEGEVVDD